MSPLLKIFLWFSTARRIKSPTAQHSCKVLALPHDMPPSTPSGPSFASPFQFTRSYPNLRISSVLLTWILPSHLSHHRWGSHSVMLSFTLLTPRRSPALILPPPAPILYSQYSYNCSFFIWQSASQSDSLTRKRSPPVSYVAHSRWAIRHLVD